MYQPWITPFNALLGGAVVAAGAWLAWDQLEPVGAGIVLALMTAFLMWQGRTIGLVWAWSTLFLGVESFAWPVVTMAQVLSVTDHPSDQQMGTILSALLMGLFSAVFWLAFSYGLFKRAGTGGTEQPGPAITEAPAAPSRRRKNR